MKQSDPFDNWFPDAKKMGTELIKQALADVKGYALRSYRDEKKLKQQALEWFAERSTKVGGYGWALHHSGGNPNVIRKSINKYLIQGRKHGNNRNGSGERGESSQVGVSNDGTE